MVFYPPSQVSRPCGPTGLATEERKTSAVKYRGAYGELDEVERRLLMDRTAREDAVDQPNARTVDP
jgi:hypothetical protein